MLCKNDLEDNIALYLRERVPSATMECVLDVGSNVGWFTFQFMQQYLDCRFHLFEPVRSIFEGIRPNLEKHAAAWQPFPRIALHRLALSDREGTALVTAVPDVTVNKLVEVPSDVPSEEVEVTTGDSFCVAHGIEHVDFLKIDAEGHDFRVLVGFLGLLHRQEIDFIQVESSLDVSNTEHVHFLAFQAFLSTFGYRYFRVLNQASPHDRPYLSRADIVFVGQRAVEKYRLP